MEEFPGVIFRNGPVGRRATLVGGPEVWEVLRVTRSARAAEARRGSVTEPRLLLAEMLAPAIAEQLRDCGHDVAAATERPHLTGAADEQVPELAAGEARSVVTLNIGDFAALDSVWKASKRSHAGIVYVATSTFPQNTGFIGSLSRRWTMRSAWEGFPP